jgi:hypothetical protein
MSNGYRFIIVAVGGIVLFVTLFLGAYFGSLYSPNNKQYQAVTGNQRSQRDYQGPSQSLPDISGVPSLVERAIANNRPSSGEDHEKRDLAAQEASALWAFYMVVASFASVLITAVGTAFLYKQIVLTREAVEDTGRATAAMNRQNELTETAQRPWLEVGIEVDFISASSNGGFVLACNVLLKNIGNQPAYHAKVDHVLSPAIRNPLEDFRIAAEGPLDPERQYHSDVIILPNGSAKEQELIFLEPNDPRHHFDHGVMPQFMITVRYEWLNGNEGQSSAWFVISPIEDVEDGPSVILWGHDYSPDELSVESFGYIRVT